MASNIGQLEPSIKLANWRLCCQVNYCGDAWMQVLAISSVEEQKPAFRINRLPAVAAAFRPAFMIALVPA